MEAGKGHGPGELEAALRQAIAELDRMDAQHQQIAELMEGTREGAEALQRKAEAMPPGPERDQALAALVMAAHDMDLHLTSRTVAKLARVVLGLASEVARIKADIGLE
jgi:hypothetical protein